MQGFMSERANATIEHVKAGHLSLITRPDAVTKTIEAAAALNVERTCAHTCGRRPGLRDPCNLVHERSFGVTRCVKCALPRPSSAQLT